MEVNIVNPALSVSWLTTTDNATATSPKKVTVRNTDSFYKDDGVETRKINLTPSLLRDDSNGSGLKTTEPREVSHLLSG